MDVKVDDVRQEIGFLHDASLPYFGATIGLGASPLRFGLHGVTKLHRRLKSMRATMTFKVRRS